jgi:hypothetical protein
MMGTYDKIPGAASWVLFFFFLQQSGVIRRSAETADFVGVARSKVDKVFEDLRQVTGNNERMTQHFKDQL